MIESIMIDGVGKSIIVLLLLLWSLLFIWLAYRHELKHARARHEKYEYYRKMSEQRKDVLILGYDADPSRTWGWAVVALGQAGVTIFCCIEIAINTETINILAWTSIAILFVPIFVLLSTSGAQIIIFTDDGIERSWTTKKYEPTKVRWSNVESVVYRTRGSYSSVHLIQVRYDRGLMEFGFGNEDIDVLGEIMKHVPPSTIDPKLMSMHQKWRSRF